MPGGFRERQGHEENEEQEEIHGALRAGKASGGREDSEVHGEMWCLKALGSVRGMKKMRNRKKFIVPRGLEKLLGAEVKLFQGIQIKK